MSPGATLILLLSRAGTPSTAPPRRPDPDRARVARRGTTGATNAPDPSQAKVKRF